MKKDIYWYITILAMIAMPAAAAINFGDAAYDSLILNTTLILALIGGVATGLGFEAIGILAGHNAIKFYSQKDSRWIIAALALIAYVCIGSYELREIAFARFVPLLSGLVYVMAGLQYQAHDEKEEAINEQSANREIEILNIQLEHERQMKQDELNARVKIERVKSKSIVAGSQKVSQVNSQKPKSQAAKHYECVCGRVFEGSRSYNAHRSHCEIPASEPARIYENGSAPR